MQAALTLYDKIWLAHLVVGFDDDHGLMYVDRQMLHEVSSPQAFVGARTRPVPVYRSAAHLAVADHAVPTRDQLAVIRDPLARQQVALLEKNVSEFDISYIPVGDTRHGIVHIIGPELGFTQPGMTLVCGDSHTSTHGAFGALAMGIGASECECVLSTQTLRQKRAHNMLVRIEGSLPAGVFAKDLALAVVARIGAGGATGYAIEYAGSTVRALSMEGRMTLCNMTIEAGARNGLVAPDETTFDYLRGRPLSPSGELWDQALEYWQNLHSDQGAEFLRIVEIDATKLVPQVTWGTSPDQVAEISGQVPYPHDFDTSAERAKVQRAIDYMGLTPGEALQSVSIDQVFIGSCTNGRIEDLRAAAAILNKRSCAPHVTAIVVPGSGQVRAQAEKEGLDRIFIDAGFEWRSPGCSLCVAMNDDRLAPGIRCASTSNRNFEGRQGAGARTHLMSPAMAAACAVAGHLTDVRDWIVA